jgi:hypothetical protein
MKNCPKVRRTISLVLCTNRPLFCVDDIETEARPRPWSTRAGFSFRDRSLPSSVRRRRSWRVIIIRSKGEYLGSVEASDRERAEAVAVKLFDLDQDQYRHGRARALCSASTLASRRSMRRRWASSVASPLARSICPVARNPVTDLVHARRIRGDAA